MSNASFLTWILLTFAVYRLAEIVSVDTLTSQLRRAIGKHVTKEYSLTWYFSELINCPFCIGVWLSAFAALLLQPVDIWTYLTCWLSIAGGQAFLETIGGRYGTE